MKDIHKNNDVYFKLSTKGDLNELIVKVISNCFFESYK